MLTEVLTFTVVNICILAVKILSFKHELNENKHYGLS